MYHRILERKRCQVSLTLLSTWLTIKKRMGTWWNYQALLYERVCSQLCV